MFVDIRREFYNIHPTVKRFLRLVKYAMKYYVFVPM